MPIHFVSDQKKWNIMKKTQQNCVEKQHESIQLLQDTLCTLRLADRGSPRFGRATQQQLFEKGQVEDVYHWRFMDPNSDFWRSIYLYCEFFCLNFLSLVLFGLQVIFFLVDWGVGDGLWAIVIGPELYPR